MNPTPELFALPEVPLRSIVSLLPLQQLIVTFPLVHPAFAPLRASLLRSNRHLVLHIGNQERIKAQKLQCPLTLTLASHLVDPDTGARLYGNTYIEDFYRLSLCTLDSRTVEQLSRLMPAVVHLEVNFAYVPLVELSQLNTLLALWAPTLRTLKLHLEFFPDTNRYERMNASFRLFVGVINSTLRALEHLTLNIGADFLLAADGALNGPPVPLSVLSRLREFNFWAGNLQSVSAFILDALRTYAGDKLTSIGLVGHGHPGWNFSALARTSLAPRFTRIPLRCIYPDIDLPFICRAFPNLIVCALDCSGLSADGLVARLSALSTLGNLQFLTLFDFPIASPRLVANFTQLAPFRMLKVLDIAIRTQGRDTEQGHDRLEAPYWATLFPGVQIVRIVNHGPFCGTCYPGDNRLITDYAHFAPCLTQLLAPLKVLPSLRKLFYMKRAQGFTFYIELTREGAYVRTHDYAK